MKPSNAAAHTAASVEITEALARIAYLSDLGTPEEYIDCFSETPTWELGQAAGLPIPAATIVGRDDILRGVRERRASGVQGPGSYTAHAISTTSVTLRDDETAEARSLFCYYTGINATPTLAAVGRYHDTFVKGHAGLWVLHHRVITRE